MPVHSEQKHHVVVRREHRAETPIVGEVDHIETMRSPDRATRNETSHVPRPISRPKCEEPP
ncbi:MAG: hypothetical protein WB662_04240 [Methyloceanibacter sp.]|jgi:hypothetical protein